MMTAPTNQTRSVTTTLSDLDTAAWYQPGAAGAAARERIVERARKLSIETGVHVDIYSSEHQLLDCVWA